MGGSQYNSYTTQTQEETEKSWVENWAEKLFMQMETNHLR